jgi:hypothetical protein
MAVVIVIVPVTIRVPAMAVFIPPTMVFVPAALAGFTQFMARVVSLPAVPSVVFCGFMQLVVRFRNPPLTTVIAFG